MSDQKLWGGRFQEATDAFVEEFTASVRFDQRLAMQDIAGSKAHAQMLGSTGILSASDVNAILQGLTTIEQEIQDGLFNWQIEREDVHMNIEARLTELVGDAGKKLHTGRSRNDQVATDIRLYLRTSIRTIQSQLKRLMGGILTLAEKEHATIMPGFTHLQTAQPITFGHHLMAWFEMLMRDTERLSESLKRVNTMPLGSAALAGTTYPIDRQETARLLGFTSISENSMDAVGDRDFAIEFTANASLIMMHLSRMAEEMVIWTSAQFNFVTLPDRFCTGSSIMPQKKNPDIPELVRGKTGRVYGHLMSLLTLMKSQPLTYNKDNQEDKEPLFDSLDTVHNCLLAFADLVPHIQANRESMRAAAMKGLATATDLADYLTKKGVPFRESHDIVGNAVNECVEKGLDLSDLSLDQLRQYNDLIEEDVLSVLTLEGSVEQRNHFGGTAPSQVLAAISRGQSRLDSLA